MTISALIIDDEQLARDELKYLLDQWAVWMLWPQGANGIEAVDLIEEHHPDLVFLDVQMPGLDGFAVIKRLIDAERRQGAQPSGRRAGAVAADCVCHGLRPVRGARFRRECGGLPAEAIRSAPAWQQALERVQGTDGGRTGVGGSPASADSMRCCGC